MVSFAGGVTRGSLGSTTNNNKMNIVLYTTDLEAITVMPLSLDLIEKAERKGYIRIRLLGAKGPTDVLTLFCKKVTWLDGRTKSFFITNQEELALTILPTWLPGQQRAVNQLRKAAQKN